MVPTRVMAMVDGEATSQKGSCQAENRRPRLRLSLAIRRSPWQCGQRIHRSPHPMPNVLTERFPFEDIAIATLLLSPHMGCERSPHQISVGVDLREYASELDCLSPERHK